MRSHGLGFHANEHFSHRERSWTPSSHPAPRNGSAVLYETPLKPRTPALLIAEACPQFHQRLRKELGRVPGVKLLPSAPVNSIEEFLRQAAFAEPTIILLDSNLSIASDPGLPVPERLEHIRQLHHLIMTMDPSVTVLLQTMFYPSRKPGIPAPQDHELASSLDKVGFGGVCAKFDFGFMRDRVQEIAATSPAIQ